MTIHVTAVSNNNTRILSDALKQILNKNVYVGIPSENTARSGEEITNAELLFIQSNGARSPAMIGEMDTSMKTGKTYSEAHALYLQEHGSPLMRIPARPVIEPAIDANKEPIGNMMGKAYQAALSGDTSAYDANLNKAGMMGSDAAKGWFENPANGWPPNAPSTIKAKGSSEPLIDTGAMRKAITYVIRED